MATQSRFIVINGTVYNPYINTGLKKMIDDLVPAASCRNHNVYGNSDANPWAVLVKEHTLFPSSGKPDSFAGNSDLVLREIDKSGLINGVYIIPKSILNKWRVQYNNSHSNGNNAPADTFVNGDGTQTKVTYDQQGFVRIAWRQIQSFREFRKTNDNALEKIYRGINASAPLF